MEWIWILFSEEYGKDEFGPYDSEAEAKAGIERVQANCASLNDGITRYYTVPLIKREEE